MSGDGLKKRLAFVVVGDAADIKSVAFRSPSPILRAQLFEIKVLQNKHLHRNKGRM